MSDKRKDILERLSAGAISAEQAEEELRELDSDSSRQGFFKSFCHGLSNMDLCLDFRDSCRIVLEEELTGSLSPGQVELELGAVNGSIRVETWDSPEYRLLIKKRVKASSREEAEAIAAEYQFAEISGNQIKAGAPQGQEARRRVSVSLHLMLPAGHGIIGKVKTANGSIKVAGLDSIGLDLASSNGSIHLDSMTGGPITVSTVNGSIKATGQTSQIEAKTTNGSISLNSTALNGDTRFKTVNGSIKVAIPAESGTAFAVTASTTCGRVSMDHSRLGLRKIGGIGGKYVETRSANWDQAEKKVNLELSTVNGSIGIRETDSIQSA